MSDPRYMHAYEPSRKRRCKRIIGVEICALPEEALVHQRYEDVQFSVYDGDGTGTTYLNTLDDSIYDESDGSCDHGEFL